MRGAFFVTGNPGSGKTAVALELARRGFDALDTDEIAGWESAAGAPADLAWLNRAAADFDARTGHVSNVDYGAGVVDLGTVAWPPTPIRTGRLLLRQSEARDRAALIELLASPEVGTYVGGPRPRDELERTVPAVPGRRLGCWVHRGGAVRGVRRGAVVRRAVPVRDPAGC